MNATIFFNLIGLVLCLAAAYITLRVMGETSRWVKLPVLLQLAGIVAVMLFIMGCVALFAMIVYKLLACI